jgi:hypothetical protein
LQCITRKTGEQKRPNDGDQMMNRQEDAGPMMS